MHKFVIFFLSIVGASVFFGTADAQSIPPPNTLVATNASATQINLTWVVNGPNTGFQIERSLTSGSGFTLVATAAENATSYSNTGLTTGTVYFYRVRAIWGSIYSGYTSEVSATAMTPLYVVPPCCLVATTVPGTQINLTWGDMHNSEAGFQIWRSFTSGSGFTLIATTAANATSYSDTGVNPNTLYFYRVRAVNGSSYSQYTSEASATSLATEPPSAPTSLILTAVSSTQINLAWTHYSHDEAGFQIERSLTSGSGFTLVTTTAKDVSIYSNTGLTPVTEYFYRVRAINSVGNSAFTQEASATTLTPPTAPSQLTIQNLSTSSITLNWVDNSNDEIGFVIERANGGGGFAFIGSLTANTVTFTDTELEPNSGYQHRIRAFNSIGVSEYSYWQGILTPPTAPSGLTAQATSNSVTLNWTVNNNFNHSTFRIERSTSEGNGFVSIGTASSKARGFVDGGLLPGITNFYRVAEFNASGYYGYSPVASAKTLDFPPNAPPLAPIELTAQTTSSSSVTLDWLDGSDNETGFQVYRWPGVTVSGMELISTTPANASSFIDTGLSEGTNYLYRVRAVNVFGNSAEREVFISLPMVNNYNWIKETVVLQKDVHDKTQIENLVIANGQKSVTWNYFDGLGRPMQTVNTAISPSGEDLVQPVIYDAHGRETKRYLPYKSPESQGWYKSQPVGTNSTNYHSSPQAQFYQMGGLVAKDNYPYAQTIIEPSPLNRVLEQGAPGEAWQPDPNPNVITDKTIKHSYEANTYNEVLFFTYDTTTGFVNAASSNETKYYLANQLYANKTRDEHNNEVIEYVDKESHTVCKKVQYGVDGSSNKLYASTYYIYDDLGNLVVVLPPEAVKVLTN